MRKITSKITKKVAIIFSVAILSSFTLLKFVFDKNDVILGLLFDSLNQAHYSPQTLDDTFSEKVFDLYLHNAFNKQFLLQSDIDELNKYRHDIDDEIASQRHDFFTVAQEIVAKRIKEKEDWSKEILSQPFDHTTEEEYETDYKKLPYAKTNEDLKNEWRKVLKYRVLFRLDDMLNKAEKKDSSLASVSDKKITQAQLSVAQVDNAELKMDVIEQKIESGKLFDSLETDARKKTLKEQEDWFKRLNKITPRDRFSEFANAFTGVYDPHTQYFAPKDKKRFDQGMSGQFEGIGARLQQKDGILKVSEIIVGSPSYKQGDLKAGDDIIKVAQGAADPVDITNMDMEDAIELIKGKKGTEVRLTVRKTDNSLKVIPIIRDVIEIEETFAKSALLDNKNKLGYIYLPSFYTDFTRNGARHCSQDMRKEIEKLKKQNIKGLVVDLRDNGGGSLQEVVEMAGLFFTKGPVVQVKGKGNLPLNVMEDRNPDVVWDGPLTILINHNSASASEILAAAIQDYKRGVIMGTNSFGKGTVQSFLNLDDFLLKQFDTIKPIGSVKITQQKFYRINGGATQLKGVTPDIELPDPYALIDRGEKEYENPMPWDEITRANYQEFTAINYSKVIKNSHKRIATSPQFGLIETQSKEIKIKKDDTKYNLNLAAFRAEQKQLRDQNKKYEDLRKEIKGFNALLLDEDKLRLTDDTARLNRESKWAQNIAKDLYIYEASNVLNDLN
ncbi:carboxy terminal-processing peptidase [Aurantibacillus circumpalustris]|uniref:carboxy terminal-processing peptidase n=1 Tax=Aurantibacillus circumpalustris TaxID=3036359 RepID=UPI00295B90CB|nr:carboxy terminal-processing peptidase [Aurantibacillus circumpalustris]